MNECSTKPCSCVSGSTGCLSICKNNDGSFSCSCNAGFKLQAGGRVCSGKMYIKYTSLPSSMINSNNSIWWRFHLSYLAQCASSY